MDESAYNIESVVSVSLPLVLVVSALSLLHLYMSAYILEVIFFFFRTGVVKIGKFTHLAPGTLYLSVDFTKWVLQTLTFSFTGRFFHPILWIHTFSKALLFNGRQWNDSLLSPSDRLEHPGMTQTWTILGRIIINAHDYLNAYVSVLNIHYEIPLFWYIYNLCMYTHMYQRHVHMYVVWFGLPCKWAASRQVGQRWRDGATCPARSRCLTSWSAHLQ